MTQPLRSLLQTEPIRAARLCMTAALTFFPTFPAHLPAQVPATPTLTFSGFGARFISAAVGRAGAENLNTFVSPVSAGLALSPG